MGRSVEDNTPPNTPTGGVNHLCTVQNRFGHANKIQTQKVA